MSLDQCAPIIPTVILGEDKTLTFQLKTQDACGNLLVVPLTGYTEIQALFANADGSTLMLSYTGGAIVVTSAPDGMFTVALTAAQTALLLPSISGGYSNVEVRYTIASKLTKVLMPNSILVQKGLF